MAVEPEINLVDLDIYQRSGAPHDQFAWLREHAPVFWHADGGGVGWPGFWAVTKHEDVAQVTRHPEIFSSARRTAAFKEWSDLAVERMRLMMINMDPPQHTRQRSFVNRGFTPRMIGQLEEHITQICSGLLDDIAGYGEVDFVTEIAAPLPTQVICELVGAPVEDRDRIFKLSNRVVGFDDPEMVTSPADQMQAVAEMYAYAGELAEHARLLRPPCAMAAVDRRPGARDLSGRGDCPLGQPGEPDPPHCYPRYRAQRPPNCRGRQGGRLPHFS